MPTIEGVFDILSGVLGMAVEGVRPPKNPCKPESAELPTATTMRTVPRSRNA